MSIVQCYPMTAPTGTIDGGQPIEYAANWYVQTSSPVAGPKAVELAQDTSLDDPLPLFDAPLDFKDSGGVFTPFVDARSFADYFDPRQVQNRKHEDFRNHWFVEVKWRPKSINTPGEDGKDPWDRLPRWSWGRGTITRTTTKAWKVVNASTGLLEGGPGATTDDDTLREMINANDEPLDPLTIDQYVGIANIVRAYRDPSAVYDLNVDFDRSTNSTAFQFMGRSVSKHHAMWMGATSSDPQFWNGVEFYWVTSQIMVSRSPWYTYRRNQSYRGVRNPPVGTKPGPADLILFGQPLDDRNLTVSPPYLLIGSGPNKGEWAQDDAQYEGDLVYLERIERDYTDLVGSR